MSSTLLLLLIVSVLVGLVLARLSRRPSKPAGSVQPGWVDVAVAALLGVAGVAWSLVLHGRSNPGWLPEQRLDAPEFLAQALHFVDPALGGVSIHRFPLYPWISSELATVLELPVSSAALGVAVVAMGLWPVAVFLLSRSFAPTPIAVVGALLVPGTVIVRDYLGLTTDYPLTTLLELVALTLTVRVVWRNSILGWLGLGVALALLLASSMSALGFILPCLGCALASLAVKLVQRDNTRATLGGASRLVSMLVPLMIAWVVVGMVKPEQRTLEGKLIDVARDYCGLYEHTLGLGDQDPCVLLPDGALWSEVDHRSRDLGSWRVGYTGALLRLTQTLDLLAQPLEYPLDGDEIEAWKARYAWRHFLDDSDLPHGSFAVFLVLGVLSPLLVRRRGWPERILCVALLVATLFQPLASAYKIGYSSRYLMLSLALVPGVFTLGVTLPLRLLLHASWRSNARWWWVFPAAVLLVPNPWDESGPRRQWEFAASRRQTLEGVAERQVMALRGELGAGDVVLDASRLTMGGAMLNDLVRIEPLDSVGRLRPDVLERLDDGQVERFFVLLPCATGGAVGEGLPARVESSREGAPWVAEPHSECVWVLTREG